MSKFSLVNTLIFLICLSFSSISQSGPLTKVSSTLNDSAITAEVKAKLFADPLIKSSDISVTTTKGEVFLTGKVDTELQYERAIMLADSLSETKDVNADNLHVKDSKTPLKDVYITAKVKALLLKEKLFSDNNYQNWDTQVETKNGVVYLTGYTNSVKEKYKIEQLIKSIKGVRSLESNLSIKNLG